VRLAPGALGRWAPLLIFGTVVLVGGLTIALGARSAAPPNVPPPRAAGGQAMPADHPPVEVPDDVRKIIERMVAAAKEKPDDLDVWRQLGFVQYRAGQVDPTYLSAASSTYQHILAKAPEDLDALRALGNIAYDKNDPRQAREFYKRYLDVKPDDLGVQTDLATMLLADKQFDAARQAYEAVLTKDPTFFQAQFNLAIAYRSAGDEPKALAALQRARDLAADAVAAAQAKASAASGGDATRAAQAELDEAKATFDRVNAILSRTSAAPEQAAAAPGDLHSDVEAIFRAHPIAGSRIDRFEWSSDQMARVLLRDFPMDGMPAPVREKFVERIRNSVGEAKARAQASAPLTIELVDAASGRVMETIVVGDAATAPAAAASGGAPPSGDLHTDVEAIFRAHPIVGPRVDRVDWPSDRQARVLLREFPMQAMPPMVRDKFIERVHSSVRDAKLRDHAADALTIELVDAGSGEVMATIVE
jgi:tetratricopeptide (TPR) repeat protein